MPRTMNAKELAPPAKVAPPAQKAAAPKTRPKKSAKPEPKPTGKGPRPKPGGKLGAIKQASDDFAGWKQGREVLTPVISVPTVFPQFDVATRVRGLPIQRIMMVHGPSNEGKTHYCLGLGRSFLEAGHYFFHIDAEMTTPEPWVRENLGVYADSPRFRALRPKSYEEVTKRVRDGANWIAGKREAGEDVTAIFVVDSIQKLVPRDLMEKLLEQSAEEGNVDAMKGRGGMIQAALNSAWMKELVPLMHHAGVTMVLIGRESQNTKATGMYDKTYVVGGGTAVYYDSSLVCRVSRDAWIERGSKDAKEIIGERIRVDVVKTKVGHKDGKTTRCYFHTSNGKLIPAGFDRARDVLELGLRAGVIKLGKAEEEKKPAKTKVGPPGAPKREDSKKGGGSVTDAHTGEVYGANMNKAVVALTEDFDTLMELQRRVLAVAQPEEISEAAVAQPEEISEAADV